MELVKALTFFVVFLFFAQLGASMGYHRYLAHKSFKPKRWFELLMVILGLPAGTPIQWAGNHRAHHQFADTPLDPHSPHQRGFWYAHNGWYLQTDNALICFLYAIAGPLRSFFDAYYRPRSNQQYISFAPDISADPFFSWISRPLVYGLTVTLYTLIVLISAILWMGLPGILVAWFCYVWVYNSGDAVDSFGHLFGSRPFPKDSHLATNSWILAILTFGDGWHANHHSYPKSARHGFKKIEIDTSYYLLVLLKKIGIVEQLFLK
jgi:fatty-acid desaturase